MYAKLESHKSKVDFLNETLVVDWHMVAAIKSVVE